jgi:hypothetical protein
MSGRQRARDVGGGVVSEPRKMGRPERMTEDRVQTTIRIPAVTIERLHAAATERDISVSQLASKAIADYLDRLVPIAELRLTRDP